ncbi:MAG: endonuclease/exonuclease/phosphatase family protein [Desulfobulbaceae bacterium]|nr:endonuclease/exonuclease/phosphatase family protein [Desulfobulbaceae bacterium]
MRFLLYNVRYCAGIGARFHLPIPYAGYLKRTTCTLECIKSFIQSVQPSIVGLIEIDSGSYRTENLCQADVIARELGFAHVVETKYADGSFAHKLPLLRKQGNALLTNHTILGHRFHYFQEGFKRLVIEVRLSDVTIFLVHLSLRFRKRQNQLERLYKLVRDVQGPLIVAGDFNVLWGDREIELFLAATGLKSANFGGLPSHPSRLPKRQLDFILYSDDLEPCNFDIPEVAFSDHAPLVCDFKVRKNGPEQAGG